MLKYDESNNSLEHQDYCMSSDQATFVAATNSTCYTHSAPEADANGELWTIYACDDGCVSVSNGITEESTCHTNETVSTHVDCEQDSFFDANGTYYDRRSCSDGCVYYHDMRGEASFNCSNEAVFIDATNGTICAVHDQADQF